MTRIPYIRAARVTANPKSRHYSRREQASHSSQKVTFEIFPIFLRRLKLAEEMELLQRTNEVFQEGIRVKIVRVETLSTMWVRIRGWPSIMAPLNLEMSRNNEAYLPGPNDIRPGMLVAALVTFRRATLWERAIIIGQTRMGYIVFLIDWGLESLQSFSSIRLLPREFATMAPWARKLRLRGVRDQEQQTPSHREAQIITLRKRKGCLFNIDSSPGEAMSASLVLNWREGQMPIDVGAHWLRLGYLDLE